MPRALSQFKTGNEVRISCYHKGCEKVSIPVTLGEEYSIHPSFVHTGGVGRLQWKPNMVVKGFELYERLGGSGYCSCPNCRTLFGGVVIVSNGRFKKPAIFGYDPEPA